jgi:hypothetical protein
MKIAIITYGMHCNLKYASASWDFLNKLNCDIYVSTWKKSVRQSIAKGITIFEDVTKEMITDYLKTDNVCIDDEDNYTFTNGNNIERCIVHWNNCIEMIKNSGVKYDNIMLLRIDSYIFPSFDVNILSNLNKNDRIYGINEIHTDDNGQYNIDPTFFFGTFDTMMEFITDFPHHNTSLHTMIPLKVISINKFVEQIPGLHIACLRPNFMELSDEDKKDANKIRNKSLEF